MSQNPKGYTGLKAPFGTAGRRVPIIGEQQKQINLALSQEVMAMAKHLYVQAAVASIGSNCTPSADDFRELARTCETAAKGFYEGIGLVEFESEDPPAEENPPTSTP